jgi:hypothetical protein
VWAPCSSVLKKNKKGEPPITWAFDMRRGARRNQAIALPPRFVQAYGVSLMKAELSYVNN